MLDIDLVKYCLRVPAEHKRNKLGGRMLIRNSLIGVVPEYILKRHEKAGAACPSSDYQLFKKGGILEKTLKVTKLNKELKYLPNISFGGRTECFTTSVELPTWNGDHFTYGGKIWK